MDANTPNHLKDVDLMTPRSSACPARKRRTDPSIDTLIECRAVHAIMFWVLALSAMAVFAACVLVPVWLEAQEVHRYKRAMAGVVAQLEDRIDKNEARIEALRADPLVNERIVRRELNYRAEGEALIRWTARDLQAMRQARPTEEPVSALGPVRASEPSTVPPQPHPWLAAVKGWLPAWPWEDLFGHSPNRSLLLVMAGGLLLAAFVLYSPSRAPRTGQIMSDNGRRRSTQ